jgi:hypothetical protein
LGVQLGCVACPDRRCTVASRWLTSPHTVSLEESKKHKKKKSKKKKNNNKSKKKKAPKVVVNAVVTCQHAWQMQGVLLNSSLRRRMLHMFVSILFARLGFLTWAECKQLGQMAILASDKGRGQ